MQMRPPETEKPPEETKEAKPENANPEGAENDEEQEKEDESKKITLPKYGYVNIKVNFRSQESYHLCCSCNCAMRQVHSTSLMW